MIEHLVKKPVDPIPDNFESYELDPLPKVGVTSR